MVVDDDARARAMGRMAWQQHAKGPITVRATVLSAAAAKAAREAMANVRGSGKGR